MPETKGKDIIDMYFKETVPYGRLTGEQTISLMQSIEEKGNKILWNIFRYDPAFIITYFSKQDPKGNQGKEQVTQLVQDVFVKQNRPPVEENFYAGLEVLREMISFVGVYRHISEQYSQNFDQQEEQILYGSLEERKSSYKRKDHLIKQLQEQRETLEELVSAWQKPRDVMAKHNLRLVIGIAKRLAAMSSVKLLDCVQEGNDGLYRAIDGFDYRKGYQFSTYASHWIRQSIQRYIANNRRTIRAPVHVQESMHKISRIERFLRNKLQKETFTSEEIAAQLLQEEAEKSKGNRSKSRKLTQKEIAAKALEIEMLRGSFSEIESTYSLEAVLGGENEFTGKDLLADTNALTSEEKINYGERAVQLQAALSTLTPKEQRIIRRRFGIGYDKEHTLSEISIDYGLSRERIRQLEAQILQKLRKKIKL